MQSAIVVLLGLLAVASAGSPYKDCGSKAKLTQVDINGCTKPPCLLPKGANAAMTIKFVSQTAATKVDTNVHGIIAGIPVPFSVPGGAACENNHIAPACPRCRRRTRLHHRAARL